MRFPVTVRVWVRSPPVVPGASVAPLLMLVAPETVPPPCRVCPDFIEKPPLTLLKPGFLPGDPPLVRILGFGSPGNGVTKQGFKDARPVVTEHIDPRGKEYYWIGEQREGFHADGNTDFEAIDEGFVSVTPMRADLTNYSALEVLKHWAK